MNTPAIEAGQNALREWLGGCTQDYYDQMTYDVIEAARPHIEAEIRAQIAAEVREAQAQEMGANPFDPFNANLIMTGYIAGLRDAARIVEGKQ